MIIKKGPIHKPVWNKAKKKIVPCDTRAEHRNIYRRLRYAAVVEGYSLSGRFDADKLESLFIVKKIKK